MKSRNSVATVLIALAACAGSAPLFAQEQGAPARSSEKSAQVAPRAEAAREAIAVQQQAADKPAAPPATPARPTRLHPRRHVWQTVGPEPTVNLAPIYSPTLTPRPPTAPPPPSVPGTASATSPVWPGPVPLNSCVGNLCTDAAGGQYNMGTGNAGVNSQGRPCNRVGTTMQCF
jgi:hypothetical protein